MDGSCISMASESFVSVRALASFNSLSRVNISVDVRMGMKCEGESSTPRPTSGSESCSVRLQEALTLVWLLLIATVVATYFIQRYRVTLLPPSTVAMSLGILCGGVVKIAGVTSSSSMRRSRLSFLYLTQAKLIAFAL